MPRQALLTYDGSSFHASGAQVLRVKSAVKAGEALESFRNRCTDAERPLLIRLDLVNSPAHAAFVAAASERVSREFGAPGVDFGRTAGGMSNWFLAVPQFIEALQIIDELQPVPEFEHHGILLVHYKSEFRFLRPFSRDPLPYQHREDYLSAEGDFDRPLGQSTISALFSAQHTVSSFFSLPFERWCEDSAELVRSIQAELPFRISPKRWKRWQLNMAASGYVGRKLAVSW